MTGPVITPLPMNHTCISDNATKTSSSNAHCSSSDSTGEDSLLDDDSNPQQGTPASHKGVGPPKSAPMEGAGGVTQSSNATPVAPPTASAANGAATTSAPPTHRQPSTQNSGSRDPSAASSASKFPPTVKDIRKLFVGGLPSDVTSEEFRQFFEQYGTVLDSVVMFDRITTRSRGFGFVTFEDYAVGQHLVKMGHVPMRSNKFVEIKPAEPKGSLNMNQQSVSARYHHHSSLFHPTNGRGTFGGTIPMVPTTTTVSIMGETAATSMDLSSAASAWTPTISASATPTRASFPPPFYPSPNVMMDHNSMATGSPIAETATILNTSGGGICMDMPSAAPFMMPYPMYPSYDGAYPNGVGPTSAPPLYSAPLYDMYAGPGYTASFVYEAGPMARGTPTSPYEAPWVNSYVPEENGSPPSEEQGVERSS